MSYTAEVKGKSADRFRAYATTKMLRRPYVSDHIKRERAGLDPLPKGSRIRYDGQHPAIEGPVSGSSVSIAAKDITISKVVFYAGPLEEERVVGSVDVNVSGDIAIEFVEPPADEVVVAGDPVIVDE